LDRCADDRDLFRRKDGIEGSGELRVAIVDQVLHRQPRFLQPPTRVARLLRDPCGLWLGRTAGEMDTPGSHFDEKQDVEGLQPHRFDREKVARQHLIAIMVDQREFLPTGQARRVGLLALENAQLLPEQYDLDILVTLAATTQPDEVEQQ